MILTKARPSLSTHGKGGATGTSSHNKQSVIQADNELDGLRLM